MSYNYTEPGILIKEEIKSGNYSLNKTNFLNASEDLQSSKAPNYRYTEEKLNSIIEQGRVKLQERAYPEAVKLFTQILSEIDSEHPEATFLRALAYLD